MTGLSMLASLSNQAKASGVWECGLAHRRFAFNDPYVTAQLVGFVLDPARCHLSLWDCCFPNLALLCVMSYSVTPDDCLLDCLSSTC